MTGDSFREGMAGFKSYNGTFVPHGARLCWEAADEDEIVELPDHRLPTQVIAEMEWCTNTAEYACQHVRTANATGTASMLEKIVVAGVPAICCPVPMCVAALWHAAAVWNLRPVDNCVFCNRVSDFRVFQTTFRDSPQALSLICWVCDNCVHGPVARWAGVA